MKRGKKASRITVSGLERDRNKSREHGGKLESNLAKEASFHTPWMH